MDPATASKAVVGLFPQCVSGYQVISNCVSAKKDVKSAIADIMIQSGVFIKWGEQWMLDRGETRLKDHLLEHPHTARTVQLIFIQISNLFADVKQLRKLYKIEINAGSKNEMSELKLDHNIAEDATEIALIDLERRQNTMSLLKRATFVFRDADGLRKLSQKLAEYNDALLKVCSAPMEKVIQRAMLNYVLKDGNHDLQDIAQAARQESERRAMSDMSTSVYRLLDKTANFKHVLVDVHLSGIQKFQWSDFNFLPNCNYNRGEGTVAIRKTPERVQYIEWKSYTEDPESITEIMHLGYMLGHEDKPKEVQTMRLIGVLHDTLKSRYGLVFDPDEYIAKVLPNERNLASISKSRKPLTLTSLLRGSPETSELKGHPDASDLALRFRLARQLASNVFVLHNAGWIHKGINSQSILFLPASGLPRESRSTHKLWLSGFSRSRRDIADATAAGISQMRLHNTTRSPDNFDYDIYQHPDKRRNPDIRYTVAFDLYSLGCVLWEIGLWRSVYSMHDVALPMTSRDSFSAFQEALLNESRKLDYFAGSTYGSAVRACLNIRNDGSERADEIASAILLEVVGKLESCSA